MHRVFEEGMSRAKTPLLSPNVGPRGIYPTSSTAAGLVDLRNGYSCRNAYDEVQPTCVEFQEIIYFPRIQFWFGTEA